VNHLVRSAEEQADDNHQNKLRDRISRIEGAVVVISALGLIGIAVSFFVYPMKQIGELRGDIGTQAQNTESRLNNGLGEVKADVRADIGEVKKQIDGVILQVNDMNGTLQRLSTQVENLLAKTAQAERNKPNLMIVVAPLEVDRPGLGRVWWVACFVLRTELETADRFCQTYATKELADAAVGELSKVVKELLGDEVPSINECASKMGGTLPEYVVTEASFCLPHTPRELTMRIHAALGKGATEKGSSVARLYEYNSIPAPPDSWEAVVQYLNADPDFFYYCAYATNNESNRA
jgi:hypothetical protein